MHVRRPILEVLIGVALLAASSPGASAADYYINATGPLGNGSGTSAANAADATPGKYDAIVRAQKSAGTVIIYAPGTYYLYPALPMFDGVTHKGAGVDTTIVKIADGAAAGSFTPMFLAGGGKISGWKFTDATIDFNSSKTAWWAQGLGKCIAFAFSLADHCTIQRVKFINIGSKNKDTKGPGSESFPVFFNVSGSAKGNMHDNLVDSCIFTQPIVKGNVNGGLTCIQMADSLPDITTDVTNVVSNNQFLNLKAPEYSDLPYAQCCSCPVAINNEATGVDSLWFVEPGSASPAKSSTFDHVTVQVTGNRLTDSGPIALLLMHPNGAFGGNLNVADNKIGMTSTPYKLQGPSHPNGFAVATYWPGDSAVGNITVRGNTFTAPSPANSPVAVQANPTAPNLFHIASLSVVNNTYVNFPQAAAENNVNKSSACIQKFTDAGNKRQP